MAKRFYLRKTQSELLQEQIRLIEMILNRPQAMMQESAPMCDSVIVPDDLKKSKEDYYIEEATPFIPNIPKSSAKLSISTSKTTIDEEEITKLKRIRADATKLV